MSDVNHVSVCSCSYANETRLFDPHCPIHGTPVECVTVSSEQQEDDDPKLLKRRIANLEQRIREYGADAVKMIEMHMDQDRNWGRYCAQLKKRHPYDLASIMAKCAEEFIRTFKGNTACCMSCMEQAFSESNGERIYSLDCIECQKNWIKNWRPE